KGHTRAERGRGEGAVRTAATNCFNNGADRCFTVAEQMFACDDRRNLHVAIDIADDAKRTAWERAFVQQCRSPIAHEDGTSERSSFNRCMSECSITRCIASVCGVEFTGTRIEHSHSRCSTPPSKPTS